MNLALVTNGIPSKVGAAVLIGEVTYTKADLEAYSPAERSALGVVEYQPAGPVPAGQRVVSTYLASQDGAIVEKYVLEPIPLEERKAVLLAAIDAERDRRQQLDLVYDFGETVAIDDGLQESPAGVKALQMRKTAPNDDQQNWDVLQGQALAAVVMGQHQTVLPMRAEDNFNIQTSAEQVLAVTSAMVQRNAAILFHGGALKSQVRNATTGAELDAININIGWPG
jgi:hypothetical protein